MATSSQVKRVLIYSRVSRTESKHLRSVRQQSRELQEWADTEGWEVIETISDQGSASRYRRGGHGRQDWDRVETLVRDGSVDAVLTWEASRLFREPRELVPFEELLEATGVLWGYKHDLYDMRRGSDRKRVRDDVSSAAYEVDLLSERVQRALAEEARLGLPHGPTPYGLRRVFDQVTGELVDVVEDPVTVEVVRRIFSEYAAGRTVRAICADLNEAGIAPRTNRATGWRVSAINSILQNSAYIGRRIYKGADVGETMWPAVIDKDTWDATQKRMLAGGPHKPSRGPAAAHLLSGIAVCDVCGAVLVSQKQWTGNPGNRIMYRMYICPGAKHVRGGSHVSMKEEYVDLLVTEAVIARLSRPDFLAMTSTDDSRVDSERQRIIDEIDKMQSYLDMVREQAAETLDISVLLDQEKRVKPKIDALRQELEKLAGVDPSVVELAGSDDIRSAWGNLDLEGQRHIVRSLMVPVVGRSTKPGQRGPDPDRVEIQWR